ncbi:HisA/HisF-related TIM barrel protein [Sulfobacillus thermosulfidooxidans]|uniref:HisA/HisF-related TIM barrel protein n=1 Tax=Sulfobacillus thermosulfidooxidans TaxID=28034 RepID=UPI00096BAC41|nr:HisA/HisF-related TIM barrel protein [Sulfobacillus thermosulfidooxidans]OLZ10492.1 hypothetical protein BFX05_01235 [Sulfobacillus thermosulfidooxidans]OLZ14252.1 hypothetical protein BFX06_08185 [Sulfobacillus thermosulfidooxidans]OLZ18995.1 hypothetical protein BFX07_04580 [Sulfobacillus thermosulfidooxidans]
MSTPSPFNIVPVMHISSGRVIRWQGDHFIRCHGIEANPLSLALHWLQQGAHQLHVIDLDAAQGRASVVPALLLALMNKSAQVSVGGGIHNVCTAKERLSYGASHIVVGSLLADPLLLHKVVRAVGLPRIWGSIPVENGNGIDHHITHAKEAGLHNLVLVAQSPYTMAEPANLRLIEKLTQDGFTIWTSGQIHHSHELVTMYQAGAKGAFISRALHDGSLRVDSIAEDIQRAGAHMSA